MDFFKSSSSLKSNIFNITIFSILFIAKLKYLIKKKNNEFIYTISLPKGFFFLVNFSL